MYFCFSHDHLRFAFTCTSSISIVIPSLNLVVSCPYVLYYLYLHTFMLFRSTCSWHFSVDNPPRVATDALNIHLVSCTSIQPRPALMAHLFYWLLSPVLLDGPRYISSFPCMASYHVSHNFMHLSPSPVILCCICLFEPTQVHFMCHGL